MEQAVDARGLVSSGPDGWAAVPCPNNPSDTRWRTAAVWFTDLLHAIGPWTPTGMVVKTG